MMARLLGHARSKLWHTVAVSRYQAGPPARKGEVLGDLVREVIEIAAKTVMV